MNVFDVLREKTKEHYEKINPYVMKNVIEIVNKVEQEYNDGWIPYKSENMPNQEVLVDCTIIRLSDNHRWVQNLIYCPHERHKWKWTEYPNDIYVDDKKFKVLAWKPLSAPFREDDIPGKQSNADRIRSMTDEELAEILVYYSQGVWCTNVTNGRYWSYEETAIKSIVEFLQSEVEEE